MVRAEGELGNHWLDAAEGRSGGSFQRFSMTSGLGR
jgi:hypothetical protein